jgi:large subunit ribosomal protein L21e
MVDRVGGMRRNTRYKMRKNVRSRGKISIREYLKSFEVGEKVLLKAEPAIQKGMYFPRFYGKVGQVTKRVGSCYEIKINDLGKDKVVVAHPVHLVALQ